MEALFAHFSIGIKDILFVVSLISVPLLGVGLFAYLVYLLFKIKP